MTHFLGELYKKRGYRLIISIVDDLTLLHGVQSIAESLRVLVLIALSNLSIPCLLTHQIYLIPVSEHNTSCSVFVLHAYNVPPVILSIKCCVLCLCYRLQRIKKGITRDQVISLFPELSIVALKRTVVIFPLSIIIKYRCYGNQ